MPIDKSKKGAKKHPKSNQVKKLRTDTKNVAKKIESKNFKRSFISET